MEKSILELEYILRFRYTLNLQFAKERLIEVRENLERIKGAPPGVITSLSNLEYTLTNFESLSRAAIIVRLERMVKDLKDAANPPPLGISVKDDVKTKDIFGRS